MGRVSVVAVGLGKKARNARLAIARSLQRSAMVCDALHAFGDGEGGWGLGGDGGGLE